MVKIMRRISTRLATVTIFLLSLMHISAAPVDSTRAMQSALGFFSALTHTPQEQLLSDGVSIAYRAYADETAGGTGNTVCFYVVNVGRKGFVMLSGDDRFKPILGYSNESSFSTKNMPENLRSWLEARRKEISSALGSGTLFPSPEIIQQWNHLSEIGATVSVMVQPLLQTTWDQDAYYNQFCPADPSGPNGHAYAGCVATAMAQIIRYWQWPWSGFNSHSYTCDYGTLSVDFSSANYNYNNMPGSIQGNSSSTQIDAVATLTYHCGVSVDMDYGPDGSGASSFDVMAALVNYFAYPSGMSYQSKSNFSSTEWDNLLRYELNSGRPILYSGEGTGGHAFICDGYDNNGTYHFNWGWSGYFNGYYALNALTPTSESYSSGYNFTDGQDAIVGISAAGTFLRCSQNGLNVSAPIGGSSAVKAVDVRGHSLSGNITVTAGDGFAVGTDGSTFSNSVTMPAQGGRLYLRYTPTLSSPGTQNANIILISGAVRDTVFCLGNAIEEVCLPPQNLTGTHTGTSVNLVWDSPTTYDIDSPATAILCWDSTLSYYSSSYGNDMTYCMLQRFETSDLSPYNHYRLTTVSFFPSSYADSYRIVVYKGGSCNGSVFIPGEQVVNQIVPMSSLSYGWNTVALGNTVIVDATQELWLGVIAYSSGNNGGSYVIRYGTNEAIDRKGNILGIIYGENDGTGSFSWMTWSYNFPIKGVVEQISDEGIQYDIYRQTDLIGQTANTFYTDATPSNSACQYTVSAVWSSGCTDNATVTVAPPAISFPIVTTNEVSNIAPTSATCGGNVISAGGAPVTARGVCWSTSQNPDLSDNHTTDNAGLGGFTSSITGLMPNTTYYVRAYATNSAGTNYGDQKTFNTSCNIVTLSISGTTTINDVQSTTLTVSGASTYSWSTGDTTSSIVVSPTSTNIYSVTGTDNDGCTGTATVTVTVIPVGLTVTTNEVVDITTTSAICGGSVTSIGGAMVTARGVCWSTSPAPTIADNHTINGTGTGSFTSSMTNLSSGTAYYVRAYATNSIGTVYGEEVSFITTCTSLQVSISGNTTIGYGHSTTLTASGADTYLWSNGATTEGIVVSPLFSRTYSVMGTSQYGCTGTASVYVTVNYIEPTVTITKISNITSNSAIGCGRVSASGGMPVTARGICWSTTSNPTIADNHTVDGNGTGLFISNIEGLTPNTTYYVRTYATNSVGTGYSEEVNFIPIDLCASYTVTITGDSVISSGDSTTLHAEVAGGEVSFVSVGDILCTDNTTEKPADFLASGKTALGVVFYVDNSGLHGWAVNLENEGYFQWGNFGVDIPDLPNKGSIDTAGYSNTLIIRDFGDASTYPAAWAVDFDNGWYLPAMGQVNMLYGAIPILNASLEIVGGTLFSMNSSWALWSSTEYSAERAIDIFNTGSVLYCYKTNHDYVRSVRSF